MSLFETETAATPHRARRRAAQTTIQWEFATDATGAQRQVFQEGTDPKQVIVRGSNLRLERVSPSETLQPFCIECNEKRPEETSYGYVETLTHYKDCASGIAVRRLVLHNRPSIPDVAILTNGGLDISGHCKMCVKEARYFSKSEPRDLYCSEECQIAHFQSIKKDY